MIIIFVLTSIIVRSVKSRVDDDVREKSKRLPDGFEYRFTGYVDCDGVPTLNFELCKEDKDEVSSCNV